MAYVITRSGLTGIQLNDGNSNIISEHITKNANLMIFPLPLSDAGSTQVFDFMGVTREVNLEGIYQSPSSGSRTVFISGIQNLIFGQQTYATYTSDTIAGSITVKVNEISYDYQGGAVSKIHWAMKFIESTTNS